MQGLTRFCSSQMEPILTYYAPTLVRDRRAAGLYHTSAPRSDVARSGGHVMAPPLSDSKITRTIGLALSANKVVRQHVRCAVDVLVLCVKDAMDKTAWPEARWLGS
jgi:hypothetical protein